MPTRPSALLDDLDAARLAMAPIRRQILAALVEPASAAGLAAQLGMPRQKIGMMMVESFRWVPVM